MLTYVDIFAVSHEIIYDKVELDLMQQYVKDEKIGYNPEIKRLRYWLKLYCYFYSYRSPSIIVMMNLMNKAGIYTLIMCMEAAAKTKNQKHARAWGIEDYLVIRERLK